MQGKIKGTLSYYFICASILLLYIYIPLHVLLYWYTRVLIQTLHLCPHTLIQMLYEDSVEDTYVSSYRHYICVLIQMLYEDSVEDKIKGTLY